MIQETRRKFWLAFGLAAEFLLTAIVLLTQNPEAKIVIAVLGLSGTYIVWSVWMLMLAWRSRPTKVTEEIRMG